MEWLKGNAWLISLLSVLVSLGSASFACFIWWEAHKENLRAEQLFGSQVRPLIQSTPDHVYYDPVSKMMTTKVVVTNYSGFDAYNISVDVKYSGDYPWIGEWKRAEADDLQKKKSGETKTRDPSSYSTKAVAIKSLAAETSAEGPVTGFLPLYDLCEPQKEKRKESDVFVRTTWENKKRHVFDRVRRYTLVCTKVGEGRSFTFVPQEIVSQED